MKKFFLGAAVFIFVLAGILPSAHADKISYRDARMFGKLLTEDIMYGSVFYRKYQGEYRKLSSGTFQKIQPMYDRHYQELKNHVGSTIILTGKLKRLDGDSDHVFIYNNIENNDYNIKLDTEYYLSKIKNYQEGYGTKLKNNEAMMDLVVKLNKMPDKIEDDKDKHNFFEWKNKYLNNQQFISKNNNVKNKIRNNLKDIKIIKYKEGKNKKMAIDTKISLDDFKKFMINTRGHKTERSPELEEGRLTMYGEFKEDRDGDYYFTGIPGHTLLDWVNNIKNNKKEVVTWELTPHCEIKEKCCLPNYITNKKYWVSGDRYKVEKEDGSVEWYFNPSVYIPKEDFIDKLNYYKGLTGGEILR